MSVVSEISLTPVKGFALEHLSEVELGADGVETDRRFFLVDGEGQRLRSSVTAWPIAVGGRYDPQLERLAMTFPDGTRLEASAVAGGDRVVGEFEGRNVPARVVEGPWDEPLSELAGHPVRLARPERGSYLSAPVSIVSQASVARLGEVAGDSVDGRRFRMLFTVGSCRPHEEDEWLGRRVRVGDAVVRVTAPVPRCAATTRDPDTGQRDLDTLRLIKAYRGQAGDGSILFGVLGRVEQAGRVRVGDGVEPL